MQTTTNSIRLSRQGLPPSFIPVLQISTTYVSPVRVRPLSTHTPTQLSSISAISSPIARVIRRPEPQHQIISSIASQTVTPPSMIKTIPKETERVGGICASYLRPKQSTPSAHTPVKQLSAVKQTDKAHSVNHSYSILNRSQAMTNDSILQPSHQPHPQQTQQQQHKQQQSGFLNNSVNQGIDSSFMSSNGPNNTTNAKNSLFAAPGYLQNNSNILSKDTINERYSSPNKSTLPSSPTTKAAAPGQIVKAAFSTPLRNMNVGISHDDLKARLASGGGEWQNPIEESAKCKIFSEDFLEQREKDFKRRIDNLELQTTILKDQLKFKDDHLEESKRENADQSRKITSLENSVAAITNEKEQIHYNMTAEIERLNDIINQLNKENAVLMQSQSTASQMQRRF